MDRDEQKVSPFGEMRFAGHNRTPPPKLTPNHGRIGKFLNSDERRYPLLTQEPQFTAFHPQTRHPDCISTGPSPAEAGPR